MKQLILKPEYFGLTIVKNTRYGTITLDTLKVQQDEYKIYFDLGFKECFEEVTPYKNIEYRGIENDKKVKKSNS